MTPGQAEPRGEGLHVKREKQRARISKLKPLKHIPAQVLLNAELHGDALALSYKKDDKWVVIDPNKKLYINNSKVVYKSVDYKNMQIKFDDRGEVILSFNSINSFRYQETLKIWNILEKTRKYRVLGVFNGGVGGVLSGIVEYGDLPDDQLGRMAKLFALIGLFFI